MSRRRRNRNGHRHLVAWLMALSVLVCTPLVIASAANGAGSGASNPGPHSTQSTSIPGLTLTAQSMTLSGMTLSGVSQLDQSAVVADAAAPPMHMAPLPQAKPTPGSGQGNSNSSSKKPSSSTSGKASSQSSPPSSSTPNASNGFGLIPGPSSSSTLGTGINPFSVVLSPNSTNQQQGWLPLIFGNSLTPIFGSCLTNGFVTCTVHAVFHWLSTPITDLLGYIVHSADKTTDLNTAGPWLQQYELGLGLAFLVMIPLLMRLFYRMARYPERGAEVRESFLHYLPIALIMWFIAPAIGVMLQQMSDGLTQGIIQANRQSMTNLSGDITKLVTGFSPPVTATPTGTVSVTGVLLAGFIVMILLLFVLLAVILQLALQSIALWMTGAVMGIAFIMMIDPELRQRAIKLPYIWLGAVLGKPLLFFLLGVMGALIDDRVKTATSSGPVTALVSLLIAVIGIFVVALAPLSLMKFAPLIPGGGTDIGAAGPAVVGGAIGGQVSAVAGGLQQKAIFNDHAPAELGGQGGQSGTATGHSGHQAPPAANALPRGAGASRAAWLAGPEAAIAIGIASAAASMATGLAGAATSGIPGSD